MKTKKNIALLFAGILFLLNSCQKNIDVFVPDYGQINGPDTNWIASISSGAQVSVLKNNLLLVPVADSFENTNISPAIVYPGSLKCTFPANSLVTSSGLAAAGKMYINTLLLKTKGDMIRMDKPTIADGNVLASAGALFISLKKGDSVLNIAQSGSITIDYLDTNPVSINNLYNGDESNPQQFNWLLSSNPNLNNVTTINKGYEIKTNSTGWISPAYTYLDAVPKTIVTASLTNQFTNANTAVYLVFKNILAVVNMYGNNTTKKFSSGNVPVDNTVTVVVISKQGNDYYLGYKDALTASPAAGSLSQVVAVTPIKVSLAAIKNYLGLL